MYDKKCKSHNVFTLHNAILLMTFSTCNTVEKCHFYPDDWLINDNSHHYYFISTLTVNYNLELKKDVANFWLSNYTKNHVNLRNSSTKIKEYLCPADDKRVGLHRSLNTQRITANRISRWQVDLLACLNHKIYNYFGKKEKEHGSLLK